MSLSGWISGWTGKRGADEKKAEYEQSMEDLIASVAEEEVYQSPAEVAELQKLYSTQASELRTTGQEVASVAESKANQFSYGAGAARQDVRSTTASAVQDLTTASGTSSSYLGALTQLGVSNTQSMRDLAVQNQQYRDQSQRDYLQALREKAGLESQAVSLEAQGLQVGISEADKVYESELERTRMLQNLEIALAGNKLA